MQHYKFPIINSLDDIIPHIEGRKEFMINDRDGFKVVDYAYCCPDSFPPIPVEEGPDRDTAIMRRECRGLLFNQNGNLLSRRFHKFHNIGEREETRPENIDFTQPHNILDKLDGSMISSYMDPYDHVKSISQQDSTYFVGKVFWGTMYGNTEVANGASEFVEQSNYDYEGFARDCMSDGWTPIFEWCSLKNRVVVVHDQAKLVLTAIRHNVTGCYKSYDYIVDVARNYNIPVVSSWGTVTNSGKFIQRVRDETDIEGYVVRFDNGHSVKIKCDWYIRFHNSIENLVYEKNVWKLIVNDDIDDILPALMKMDRDHIIEFNEQFNDAMNAAANDLSNHVKEMQQIAGSDSKKYAELVKNNNHLTGNLKGMAFKINATGCDPIGLIREFAEKSTGSQNKIEEARKIIKVSPWK